MKKGFVFTGLLIAWATVCAGIGWLLNMGGHATAEQMKRSGGIVLASDLMHYNYLGYQVGGGLFLVGTIVLASVIFSKN